MAEPEGWGILRQHFWGIVIQHLHYAGKALDIGKRKAEEAAFYTELSYEEAIDYVRQRPIAALSMAMGIGLVLGLATARR